MSTLDRVLTGIDCINDWVGRLISYLAILMVLSVSYEVVARYLFNRPTLWSMEINQYILCWYTALAGGYILLNKSHVNVDIIFAFLKPRTQALLNILTSVFFFSFIGILIWKSGAMAWEAWEYWEKSESLLAFPLFPVKVAVPVGGGLLLLQGIAKLIRDIRTLRTGAEEGKKAGIFDLDKKERKES
jgi:TRAP-type mannitol/chloroaromatic compound transport system permease small subunit